MFCVISFYKTYKDYVNVQWANNVNNRFELQNYTENLSP